MTSFIKKFHTEFPEGLYCLQRPVPVSDPMLVYLNTDLLNEMEWTLSEQEACAIFSGNQVPESTTSISMAYAGHQFGVFVPRLGDGRAVLLGEWESQEGKRWNVQLKGSGRTPFSRGGDGRAALGPVIREVMVSEAMAALGVPTTRALAAVTTGETVYRESPLPGAIITRVLRSTLRVGSFQFLAVHHGPEAVADLLAYTIQRHFPQLRSSRIPAIGFLEEVAEGQAALIAKWMCIGFIHGVMNTDNMSIVSETIDYGPCAFMDEFDPEAVFSAIDVQGRYAFCNQAGIAQWNISRLAETLMPLDGVDPQAAQRIVDQFPDQVARYWRDGMRKKLGISHPVDQDEKLMETLLSLMQTQSADFTQTFRALYTAMADDNEAPLKTQLGNTQKTDQWIHEWKTTLQDQPNPINILQTANPAVIPRNHVIEAIIRAAVDEGDFAPMQAFQEVMKTPYQDSHSSYYQRGPSDNERVTQTFCGT